MNSPDYIDLRAKDTRGEIRQAWLADENIMVAGLMGTSIFSEETTSKISRLAQKLIQLSRNETSNEGGLDAFLQEYNLSSEEGVVLMCLAEALLRVPDSDTVDRLIRDKISGANWASHLGHSHSLMVNASTWGLMLTGKFIALDEHSYDVGSLLHRLISRSGEPLIRVALKEAMHIMARQFVMGRTIDEAIKRSSEREYKNYLFSYDMLGEAALCQKDADRFFDAYTTAIKVVGLAAGDTTQWLPVPLNRPGVSIKLSALHPRLEISQRQRVLQELVPRVKTLCSLAMQYNIGLTIDAEESTRLELLLDVFTDVFTDAEFSDWSGIGLAVQAYQKRALPLLRWLKILAQEHEKIIMLRLVKGAYWDTEIKLAQEHGLRGYPVYTRKASTDLSYLACAGYLHEQHRYFYPQFATHNAYTISSIVALMGGSQFFEFQALHGMGKPIYAALAQSKKCAVPVRIYAPVGSHRELLPYLVRRLLENGANTSFLNRFANINSDLDALITPPVELLKKMIAIPHPKIVLPNDLYAPTRANSMGENIFDLEYLRTLETSLQAARSTPFKVGAIVNGKLKGKTPKEYFNPANTQDLIGLCFEPDAELVNTMIASAHSGYQAWSETNAEHRATILNKAAALLETRHTEFVTSIVREGGRCITDALAEIREAVDYCHYYAAQIRESFSQANILAGPTGERNELSLRGRGVFACISPWNFPLAIFTGQITAALVTGNSVIAKPAQQTPFTAYAMVRLLHEAGIPREALQLAAGSGIEVGKQIVNDLRIKGIAFTGSTQTAAAIQSALSTRGGPMIPFIAETGGQNAMIADSSALPEQVVKDVLQSAFNSAGQRCSALRVLFLQNSIAPAVIELLIGAMDELRIGDPSLMSTDIGPLISADALDTIKQHHAYLDTNATLLKRCALHENTETGHFLAPAVYEINTLELLRKEVFGPVLHIIRYNTKQLDEIVDAINACGYGLTLGIHSRIDHTVDRIIARAHVGNIYVNRNIIGAVVGVQPFGGEGLSGTGPKAGGPHYLQRFVTERMVTMNTAAVGGNTSLLNLGD